MTDMEKNQFYCGNYPDDDQEFSERDHENPSPQVRTAGKPQEKKKGFFKSIFGGFKNRLGGGDKNNKRKLEEELALQPKAQQSQGVPQSPKDKLYHSRKAA